MAYLGRRGASAPLTSADIPDNVIQQADIQDDAVGTDELANDVVINTSGAITTTGINTSASLVLTPGTAPGSPAEGAMYYDSGSDVVKVYNGSSWNTISNFPYKTAGGIVTNYTSGSDTYIVHTFLESGKFFVHSTTTIDYLIVGGGGGGGGDMGAGNNGNAGGGGAGGMLVATSYAIAVGEHAITVGAGGHNNKGAYNANNGGDSSIGSLFTAFGGGHGGSYPGTTHVPGSGNGTVGSAGGQGQSGSITAGWTGTPAQGNFGSPYSGGTIWGGGGGGGAGGAGFEATGTNGSTGGYGGSALGNAFRTGATEYYAGGGAGSTHDSYNLAGLGGNSRDPNQKGGGGDGKWGQAGGHGLQGGAVHASNGLPNTGGGGGGGEGGGSGDANGQRSGDGGSGIVVIRYTI
jgi:hypothetical protein